MAFRDNHALKLKPEDTLRTVAVCNVSGSDSATAPDVSISVFDKSDGGTQKLMDAKTAEDTKPWKAGECRDVVLTLSGDIPAGANTGQLTVASAVGITRLAITITGKAPDAKPTPATPVSPEPVLQATRTWPWSNAQLNDGGDLALNPAHTGQTLSVPDACPAGNDPCSPVGVLANGAHGARLFVDGGLSNETPPQLPLRLDGADRAGTYAGTIDLAASEDTKDDVKVSVNVKDSVRMAVLALLLGALLSFAAQYGLRTSMPKRQLRDRYRDFADEYRDALATFNKARDPESTTRRDWTGPTPAELEAIAGIEGEKGVAADGALERGVTLYRKSTIYWDIASEPYKQLDASVTLVEDDIECLRDPAQLHAALKKLESDLTDLATFLNRNKRRYHSPTPRFVRPAAALLRGFAPAFEGPQQPGTPPQLSVGQATAMRKEAKAATALIATWTKLAKTLVHYDVRWDRLARIALAAEDALPDGFDRGDSGPRWLPEHLLMLIDAFADLGEARYELFAVLDADELQTRDTAADLDAAYEKLAYLSSLYDHPGALVPEKDIRAHALEHFAQQYAIAGDLRQFTPDDVAESLAKWIESAGEIRSSEATAATLRKVEGIAVAVLSLAFTMLVAVMTGLAAFYFGKDTWGTVEDYLTVIFVGAAAQALVGTFVETVGRLLPKVPKQVINGPGAAVLKTPDPPALPAAAT